MIFFSYSLVSIRMFSVVFNSPLDSLARSQETPPAHRPHWPSQSPQNPVGNLSLFSLKNISLEEVKIHSDTFLSPQCNRHRWKSGEAKHFAALPFSCHDLACRFGDSDWKIVKIMVIMEYKYSDLKRFQKIIICNLSLRSTRFWFEIVKILELVERRTWLPGFMMSITSNSFFLIVRTLTIFCCSFSSWGI